MGYTQLPLDPSRVTIARLDAGIDTITELAKRAGLDRAHLNKVLAGRKPATPYVVGRLARTLGVSVAELLRANGKEAEG